MGTQASGKFKGRVKPRYKLFNLIQHLQLVGFKVGCGALLVRIPPEQAQCPCYPCMATAVVKKPKMADEVPVVPVVYGSGQTSFVATIKMRMVNTKARLGLFRHLSGDLQALPPLPG